MVSPLQYRRAGFTLIEILVVVAILGILATLLFPSITAATSAGKNAACVSNLKQMGAALFSYAADHDGALPPGSDISESYYWFQLLNEDYMGGNPANRYSPNRPAWLNCPAKQFPNVNNNLWECIGYGWNYGTVKDLSFNGKTSDGGVGYQPQTGQAGWGNSSRLSQVTQASKTVIIGDSLDFTNMKATYENKYLYAPTGSRAAVTARASRHGGRGNYLMIDGHVEALPPNMDGSYFQKIK